MTALGIIGIILASVIGIGLLVGVIAAFLDNRMEAKKELIRYKAEVDAEYAGAQLHSAMESIVNLFPAMIEGITKAFGEDEEA